MSPRQSPALSTHLSGFQVNPSPALPSPALALAVGAFELMLSPRSVLDCWHDRCGLRELCSDKHRAQRSSQSSCLDDCSVSVILLASTCHQSLPCLDAAAGRSYEGRPSRQPGTGTTDKVMGISCSLGFGACEELVGQAAFDCLLVDQATLGPWKDKMDEYFQSGKFWGLPQGQVFW